MKKNRWLWVIVGLVVVCILGSLACVGVASFSALASKPFGDAVAIVYVEGAIVVGEETTSGSAYSETIIERLRQAANDSSVKAIVLRIESPGGSVVASRQIYDELVKIKSKGKPIVASMGEIAASGGYYIAAPADKIYANAATFTGSIGVISVLTNLQELTDKIGIKMIVVKSGAHKDESYGFRALSPEELVIWQNVIDEAYGDFVDIVAQGRKMDVEQVKKLADGRIYTGKQAKANGLVDEIGDLDAAVQEAAKLGKISGDPRTIKYRSNPSFFSTFGASLGISSSTRDLVDLFAMKEWGRVMYLYVAP